MIHISECSASTSRTDQTKARETWIYFRAEIRRLTKLLNETPSRRSSQMAELSEMDETSNDVSIDTTGRVNTR